MEFLVLLIPLAVAFWASLRGIHPVLAWIISVPIIPVLAILDWLFPSGGGASFFPISMIIGGFYGVISGGIGAIFASIFLKIKENKTKGST